MSSDKKSTLTAEEQKVADDCEEKVSGVRRYEHGCAPGSSSQYWVPCNRVKSTADRALCRKAGY